MEDNVFNALYCLKGAVYQLLTALAQHLDLYVVGYELAVNQLPQKIVLDLGCGGEAHLYLFEAHVHKIVEEFHFFGNHHGIYEGLVSVPQIHRTPYGCLFDLFTGPGTLRKIHHGISFVSFNV